MSADEQKAQARIQARDRRKQAFRQSGEDAAQKLAGHLLRILENRPARTLAAYWAVGSEIDLSRLMEMLSDEGWNIGLPVVVAEGQPLIFRRWLPGDNLVEGPLNTLQPQAASELMTPEIILVPLLAFDEEGYRLGQGGGFYDRTLAALKTDEPELLTIGVGFASQRMDTIPRDQYDQRLDMVVTEEGRL